MSSLRKETFSPRISFISAGGLRNCEKNHAVFFQSAAIPPRGVKRLYAPRAAPCMADFTHLFAHERRSCDATPTGICVCSTVVKEGLQGK
jgi:hypothetical protein